MDSKITVLLEEYKQTLAEISEYSKNGLQITSIFLVLLPIGIGFAEKSGIWFLPLIQIVILVFVSLLLNMDNNIMMDSAHAINIEKKLNELLGEDIVSWQQKVNYLGSAEKRGFGFYIAPIMVSFLFMLFYIFICYKVYISLESCTLRIWHISISSVLYLTMVIINIILRKKIVSDIEGNDILKSEPKLTENADCEENTGANRVDCPIKTN